ncbi:hypothetical protein [uncultured Thiodictyon sp.]|uniref:metallophosphoesterase family protein n=1 Tax=uncultured Thiodictyon sp. TaxID=1846217 RepID=UPI0025E656E7|nr:hypothetical protein [uncultured Thiodictyon sp.]
MNDPIRLLHLSDIHVRAGTAWDSDPVLAALTRFIASEVSAGLTADLVVITGDLAFAGKAEEYALARAWLEGQLWPALSLPSAPALVRDFLGAVIAILTCRSHPRQRWYGTLCCWCPATTTRIGGPGR